MSLETRSPDGWRTLSDLDKLRDHERFPLPIPVGDLRRSGEGKLQFLPLAKLTTMPQVFQPRTFEGQQGVRHAHVQDLVDAISRGAIEDLGPLLIWWSGAQWVIIDGHHRKIAVDRFNSYLTKKGRPASQQIKEVPVSVVQGTLSEVLKWATKENGKSTLTMTAKERSNWAWRTGAMHWGGVIQGDFVIAKRYKELHVSERLLRQMKAAFHKIEDKWRVEHQGKPMTIPEAQQIAELSWGQAQQLAEGVTPETVWDDAKRHEAATKMAERLIKAIGKEAFSTTRAGIVAEALMIASARFPALSLESLEWTEAISKALARTGEDELEEDFEFDEGELADEDDLSDLEGTAGIAGGGARRGI